MNNETFLTWCRETVPISLAPAYRRKPLIMGIVNVTPDSFSDGGLYSHTDRAFTQAINLIEQGADIVDIGGESSRPGAAEVSDEQEMERVIPVIEQLRNATDTCLSIDTSKASVMREAVAAGAGLINDIKALRGKNSLITAAQLNVPVCLMHMQGEPKSMQIDPFYQNSVVNEINDFFKNRITACLQAGIAKDRLILDPGFGFGKTDVHNMQILKDFTHFQIHQLPLLLGVSRKSTIGNLLQKPVHERVMGGVAFAVFAALQGLSIIRTHDAEETKQALMMIDKLSAC